MTPLWTMTVEDTFPVRGRGVEYARWLVWPNVRWHREKGLDK